MSLPTTSISMPRQLPEPLVELRRMLTRSRSFSLGFVVCNVVREEQSLMDQLVATLPADRQILTIRSPLDPHELIHEIFAAGKNLRGGDVLFVTRIDELVPSSDPHPALLQVLNQIRDRFRQIQAAVVFWVPDFVLNRIAQQAPDFWAWRSGVYKIEFDQAKVRDLVDQELFSAGEFLELQNLATAEREELYGVLKRLWDERLTGSPLIDGQAGDLASRLAQIAYLSGRFDECRNWLKLAAENQETISDSPESGMALHRIAALEFRLGNPARAREYWTKALSIAQAIGYRTNEAEIWQHLSLIDLQQDQHDAARIGILKSLEIQKSIGDQAGQAKSWSLLAMIDHLQGGNDKAARESLLKSLELQKTMINRAGQVRPLHLLATINLKEGNDPGAREAALAALEIQRSMGNRTGAADSLHLLAIIDMKGGNEKAAREDLFESLEIQQSIGDRAGQADSWYQLALIDVMQGKDVAARDNLMKSLEFTQSIGDFSHEADVWRQFALLANTKQDILGAARLMGISMLIHRDLNHVEADPDFAKFIDFCRQLGYDDSQTETMLAELEKSYEKDRGAALLKEIFGSLHEENPLGPPAISNGDMDHTKNRAKSARHRPRVGGSHD